MISIIAWACIIGALGVASLVKALNQDLTRGGIEYLLALGFGLLFVSLSVVHLAKTLNLVWQTWRKGGKSEISLDPFWFKWDVPVHKASAEVSFDVPLSKVEWIERYKMCSFLKEDEWKYFLKLEGREPFELSDASGVDLDKVFGTLVRLGTKRFEFTVDRGVFERRESEEPNRPIKRPS